MNECDYQSERHCSKTILYVGDIDFSVITSQNDTAPKLTDPTKEQSPGVITSQNDTAPKLPFSLSYQKVV